MSRSIFALAFRYELYPDLDRRLPPLNFPSNWKPETIESKRHEMEAARREKAAEKFHLVKVTHMGVVGITPGTNIPSPVIVTDPDVRRLFFESYMPPAEATFVGVDLYKALRSIYWESCHLGQKPVSPAFVNCMLASGWTPRLDTERTFVDLLSLQGSTDYTFHQTLNILLSQTKMPETIEEELACITMLAKQMGVVS